MLQNFNIPSLPTEHPSRIEQLRTLLNTVPLDGFIVPRSDVHQGEFVAPKDERLAWLTGFTGSAGMAVVLHHKVGLFVDGRYQTQAKLQINLEEIELVSSSDTKLTDWLIKELAHDDARIGFDPWLMTHGQISKAKKKLSGTRTQLIPVGHNPIDQLWTDQPPVSSAPARIHPLEYAGKTHDDKRAEIAEILKAAHLHAAILTLPDSIAWLLNIRGNDINHNPIIQSFAIIYDSGKVTLFVNYEKVGNIRDHFNSHVRIASPEMFCKEVEALQGRVLLDKDSAPFHIAAICKNKKFGQDPCLLPKACKNLIEIKGAIAAHMRDAVAMIEVLAWIDNQHPNSITEIDVVKRLEDERRKDPQFEDISFDTIAGTGSNGAIVHYRVSEETNALLESGHLLVLDSGGQYRDGTTDVTRTIPIGEVTSEKKSAYTRVAKGMINMSRLHWPSDLAGRDIEIVGRIPLWDAHLDFDHGLGHGVGSFLSVHEGPQRLSKSSHIPLRPGMILSNEPGYYREGQFGIRIENLLVVEEAQPRPDEDSHRSMLCWRTLTLVPLDRRLILVDILGIEERHWLNNYHATVKKEISPFVSPSAKKWLERQTAPI